MAAVQLTHLDFVANLLAERFPQLDVRGPSDCWLWRSRSGRHPSGYIRVRGANGRTTLPREAYRLLTGEEPAGHLWHTCPSGYRCGAARNMCRTQRSSEHLIMKAAGWRTPSMFRRYDIVDDQDVAELFEDVTTFVAEREKVTSLAGARAKRLAGSSR